MAGSPGTAGAASSSGSYATVAVHGLRRQRSMPATVAPGGARTRRRSVRRLGDDGASRSLGDLARALWAWVARRRRRKVLSRSGSSSAGKERYYGHEEYAQNFDEGAAAVEPENLSRSFSARFAGRRLAGQAPWEGHAR